jgi:short-subunit dehydrogenase
MIVPTAVRNNALLLTGVAAVVACTAVAVLDCNPSLFVADLWHHHGRMSCAMTAGKKVLQKLLGRRPLITQHRARTSLPQQQQLQKQQSLHRGDHETVWIVGASSGIGEELAYQISSSPLWDDAAAAASSDGATSTMDASTEGGGAMDAVPRRTTRGGDGRGTLILSSRDRAKLDLVASRCRQQQWDVLVLPVDVCNEVDLHRAVQWLTDARHQLDVVILNAGGGHLSPALETPSDVATDVWRRNALWPMILVPLLFQKGLFSECTTDCPPHLVVTSSIAAIMPVPLSATYAAAKHALHGYFRSLRSELPDLCIQIVMPGPVDTNFHRTSANASGQTPPTPGDAEQQHQPSESNGATSSSTTKSKMKMPVQRCARLILSTMRSRKSGETWIAQQPILAALYLQQLAPGWMQRFVYNRIGPKRVQMHRAGLDLYDPASWRK